MPFVVSHANPLGVGVRACTALLPILLFGWPPASPAQGQRPSPPNIVLIVADDLGVGDLGSYGQQIIHTPRLDNLAAGGMRFTDFYAGAAWCPPSRLSLLEGLHTGHLEMRHEVVLPEDTAANPRFLPRLLHNAGYRTAIFDKWGVGEYWPPQDDGATAVAGRPSEVGFEYFLGTLEHRDAHTYTLPPYPQEGGDLRIHPKLWTIAAGQTSEFPETQVDFIPEATMQAALDFIEAHREEPFFLYLPMALPHAEYYVPPGDAAWEPYLDAVGNSVFEETPFPGNAAFRRPVDQPRATYAAMVTRLDADVGRILDALDHPLTANTVVLFTSDNGPPQAGGFQDPEFFDSAAGLSGYKFSLQEGGIRVPLLVSWPEVISAGSTSSEPLAFSDLLPTLLDLAGAAPPANVDGTSFLGILRGEPPADLLHDLTRPLYWENFSQDVSQAVRVGRHKAVRPLVRNPRDPVALYDLEADAAETVDLAGRADACELVRSLRRALNHSRVDPVDNPNGAFSIPPLLVDCPIFRHGFENGDLGTWSIAAGQRQVRELAPREQLSTQAMPRL